MNKYKAFDVNERGYSHVSKGLPRQDNSYSFSSSEYAIALIADGHGSPQYYRSDVGSHLAVTVCSNLFSDLIIRKKDARKNVENIKRFLKRDWDNAVLEHFSNNPITEDEVNFIESMILAEDDPKRKEKMSHYLRHYKAGSMIQKGYGSTLIAVATCDDYTLGLHIGDGTCVAFYEDGSCDFPIPTDENNVANITGSLCNEDTGCRVYFFEKKPIAVFVASDGLDDSYGQGEQLYNYYRQLCLNITLQGDSFIQTLKNSLAVISEKGSKDDISIAGIYDEGSLKLVFPIIEKRLICGRLKYQLYHLKETNGGVSEYSLRAKALKYEKAKKERRKCEEEKDTFMSELQWVKDIISKLRGRFDFGNDDEVNRRTQYFDNLIAKYDSDLSNVRTKIQKLRYEISSYESTEQQLLIDKSNLEAKRAHFLNDIEQYRLILSEERRASGDLELASGRYELAFQAEKEREEDYSSARKIRDDAQKRISELSLDIRKMEEEIGEKLKSINVETISVTPNFSDNSTDDDSE